MNANSPSHLSTWSFEVFLFAILVAIFFLAPHPGVYISNNSALYLSESVRLASGEAPTIIKEGLVARGPIFAYLIAGVLAITGPSVGAAFLLMKVLFASLLFCFYKTSSLFYGRKTAVVALIMAVVSYRIYLIGTDIDTNSLLSIFLLIFLGFVHRLTVSPNSKNFFFCGLVFSLAFLTKETAVVLAPLLLAPFILNAKMNRPRFPRIVLLFFGLILLTLPWALYVKSTTGSLLPLLGHFNPQFTSSYGDRLHMELNGNSLFQLLGLIPEFIKMLPHVTFLAAPLMILFCVHFVYFLSARKRNSFWREDLLLLTAFVLYLPIPLSDLMIGSNAPRQGYVLYFILFMIGGCRLNLLWESVSPKLGRLKNLIRARVSIATIFLLATFSLAVAFFKFADYPAVAKIRRALSHYSLIPLVKSRFTASQEKGINWIKTHVDPQTPLVTDSIIPEALDFFAYKHFRVIPSFAVKTCYEYDGAKPVLFLLTYKKFREFKGTRSFFYAVDEPSILQDLKEGSVAVFIKKLGFLDEYFRSAPWAELLYKNEDIFIYKITSTPRTRNGTLPAIHINSAFEEDMEWARKNNSQAFSKLMERLQAMGIEYSTLIRQAYRLEEGNFL